MMFKSWLGSVVGAGFAGVLGLIACNSDDEDSTAGTGGTDGGTGGTDGRTGGTDGGTGGTDGGTDDATTDAGTGGTHSNGAALGAACTADIDCKTGLCLLPTFDDFFGGGPAGGYCTADCTDFANDATLPNPCAAMSTEARCLEVESQGTTATQAYCMEGCFMGPLMSGPLNGQLDEYKCHGRNNVVCTEMKDDQGNPVGTPLCVPNCQADTQCDAGKVCDPRVRVCVDTPTAGLPFGSGCGEWLFSKGASGEKCAGVCMAFLKTPPTADTEQKKNTAALCTERCVYNTLEGCGFNKTKLSESKGVCMLAFGKSGAGDEAYCVEMCDVDTDCHSYGEKYYNAHCDPVGITQGWGRGFCMPQYGYFEGDAGTGGGGTGGAAGAN